MNLLNKFTSYKVLEVNSSIALRTGHMIAQAKYYAEDNEAVVENGGFFCFSKAAKDVLVRPDDANALKDSFFIHYTEELIEYNNIVSGLKYFAVEFDRTDSTGDYCYPRALALYAGDTFTTDNFTGTLATAKFATIGTDGVMALAAAYPTTTYEGPVFAAKASTLPDGTAAAEVTLLQTHAVIA